MVPPELIAPIEAPLAHEIDQPSAPLGIPSQPSPDP
jgi:hypothetical protein